MNCDDPQGDLDPGILVRIAQTLGVPVATFLTADMPGIETAATELDDPAQALALLRLYVRLKSPEARARCLAFVVQEATRDD